MEVEFEQSKSLDWLALVHQEIQVGLETKKDKNSFK